MSPEIKMCRKTWWLCSWRSWCLSSDSSCWTMAALRHLGIPVLPRHRQLPVFPLKGRVWYTWDLKQFCFLKWFCVNVEVTSWHNCIYGLCGDKCFYPNSILVSYLSLLREHCWPFESLLHYLKTFSCSKTFLIEIDSAFFVECLIQLLPHHHCLHN